MTRNTSRADDAADQVWEYAHRITHGAADAGATGREALAQRGLAPQQLSETLATNLDEAGREFVKSTRRPRRNLARNARRLGRDLSRSAGEARRDVRQVAEQARRSGQHASQEVSADVAKHAERAQRRARPLWRRRGLWLAVAAAAVGGAAVAAYLARRPKTQPPGQHEEAADRPAGQTTDSATPASNGHGTT